MAGSKFIEIAGGDHGLVAYVDMIAREIRAVISATTPEPQPARTPSDRSRGDIVR